MHMLNQRRAHILGLLIRDYIEHPRPVGSSSLVRKHNLQISPATVRSDFAILEQNGFITQPHTSAGRIPTVRGYKYFVQYLIHEGSVAKRQAAQLKAARQHNRRLLAQQLSDLSGESIALVDRDGRYFVSGLSQLFNKPEFNDETTRSSIGELFNQFEKTANELFSQMNNDVETFIEDKRLSAPKCAVMGIKVNSENNEPFLIMMCGPLRMNYEANRALLQHIKKIYE